SGAKLGQQRVADLRTYRSIGCGVGWRTDVGEMYVAEAADRVVVALERALEPNTERAGRRPLGVGRGAPGRPADYSNLSGRVPDEVVADVEGFALVDVKSAEGDLFRRFGHLLEPGVRVSI